MILRPPTSCCLDRFASGRSNAKRLRLQFPQPAYILSDQSHPRFREMTSRRTIEALSHCRISISVTPGQRALYSAVGYSFGGRTTRSAPLSCYESGKIRFVMWRRSITDCKLNTPHLRLAIHLSSPSGRLLTSTHQCYSSP